VRNSHASDLSHAARILRHKARRERLLSVWMRMSSKSNALQRKDKKPKNEPPQLLSRRRHHAHPNQTVRLAPLHLSAPLHFSTSPHLLPTPPLRISLRNQSWGNLRLQRGVVLLPTLHLRSALLPSFTLANFLPTITLFQRILPLPPSSQTTCIRPNHPTASGFAAAGLAITLDRQTPDASVGRPRSI